MTLHTPLRISIVGNSMAISSAPWGHSVQHVTYARQLELLLAAEGVSSDIHNFGRGASLISDAVRNWELTVLARAPDVVIVHYGVLECAPGVVPSWLEKQANGWHYHGSRHARAGRRALLAVWPHVRSLQRIADRWLKLRTRRMAPERFEHELKRFLSMTFAVGDPLVLVMDLQCFGSRFTHWIPQVNDRRDQIQKAIERAAAAFERARCVPVAELIDRLGRDEALPDSVHFSPTTQVEVARLLMDQLRAAGNV